MMLKQLHLASLVKYDFGLAVLPFQGTGYMVTLQNIISVKLS